MIEFLFSNKLEIPEKAIRTYWKWNAERGEPWAQRINPDDKIVPLGIFGDSARVNTAFGYEHVVGIFMSIVLFRPKSVRASRFLLFAIGEEKLWGIHTMQVVLRRLVWSFNTLWDGVHPSVDQYGHALASDALKKMAGQAISTRCVVTEIRGDWAWHKKLWRFAKQTSWSGIRVCHWCGALSKGLWKDLYWNLTNDSSWTSNFSLEEFIEERVPSEGICDLFIKNIVCSYRKTEPFTCVYKCFFEPCCFDWDDLVLEAHCWGYTTFVLKPSAGA